MWSNFVTGVFIPFGVIIYSCLFIYCNIILKLLITFDIKITSILQKLLKTKEKSVKLITAFIEVSFDFE